MRHASDLGSTCLKVGKIRFFLTLYLFTLPCPSSRLSTPRGESYSNVQQSQRDTTSRQYHTLRDSGGGGQAGQALLSVFISQPLHSIPCQPSHLRPEEGKDKTTDDTLRFMLLEVWKG